MLVFAVLYRLIMNAIIVVLGTEERAISVGGAQNCWSLQNYEPRKR
jgi:hypothetical protein